MSEHPEGFQVTLRCATQTLLTALHYAGKVREAAEKWESPDRDQCRSIIGDYLTLRQELEKARQLEAAIGEEYSQLCGTTAHHTTVSVIPAHLNAYARADAVHHAFAVLLFGLPLLRDDGSGNTYELDYSPASDPLWLTDRLVTGYHLVRKNVLDLASLHCGQIPTELTRADFETLKEWRILSPAKPADARGDETCPKGECTMSEQTATNTLPSILSKLEAGLSALLGSDDAWKAASVGPASQKKPMKTQEANDKAMKLARKLRKAFFFLSENQQAEMIGCSWQTWARTKFYEEAQKKRPGGKRRKVSSPKTVSLTSELEAVTGEGDKEEVLQALIADHNADAEPSPLETRPRKIHSRKRL